MSDEDENEDPASQLDAWYRGMSSFGECIVCFQHIEHVLCTCISVMAGVTEEVGQIVTSEMSFRVKVSTYSALAQHLAKEDVLAEDLTELVRRLRRAEEERNRLVHSVWDLCEENLGTLRREKGALRKNTYRVDVESFSPEDFEDLQELYEGIVTDLVYLTGSEFPDLKSKLHY